MITLVYQGIHEMDSYQLLFLFTTNTEIDIKTHQLYHAISYSIGITRPNGNSLYNSSLYLQHTIFGTLNNCSHIITKLVLFCISQYSAMPPVFRRLTVNCSDIISNRVHLFSRNKDLLFSIQIAQIIINS